MSDLCIHRGGALSDGEIKGDCIMCPYHGWEYNAEGACVKIPANLPEHRFRKKHVSMLIRQMNGTAGFGSFWAIC